MKSLTALLIGLLLVGCNQKKYDYGGLRVGVSYQSITPNLGAFIAGDQNNRRFTTVHDSLYVKAMVLSDSKNTMAFLVFDCIGMLYPTLIEIRKEVSSRILPSELDPSHIVMASTHTHSGPDVVGIWGPDQGTPGVDSIYMEKIIKKSADAIYTAWQNMQSAKAVYAETQFGEDWVFNISDSLNLDRSLTILQFLDNKGKSIATLNNFACHPTIMDGVSSAVSADFVSSMYSFLEEEIGGVNFFLQGAIGGWVQPEYEAKTFESVNKRGLELGRKIITALKDPINLESESIQFKSKIVNLPVSNPNFQQLAKIGVINRTMTDSVSTEIAWFSIGNAQFVTHPGETTPTHSWESKRLMNKQGPKFVIGLGMDALGYILTTEFYEEKPKVKHAEYLTGMSIDEKAGTLLMENIKSLANKD
ncbi:neutral/alkaline non-lysosomal ceramidase N-terminal domain-containing protein [Algoriphagus lutimaris]|uniref:neutral/alkaline non-lysosomal ceramidase N-terminal domain-containing protein n=1 Tax=Algoriphagus lutimaris TaxID=613197 RepID=UPI00196B5A8C|nr:neutral/alkaline non-lysosomal ceramidase N-terminal domain-containing protein [Algoriphagus lutimaris]MBN3521037.1 neutral/alkaline non-lysosomal ceramidase N-terminal domain-containing protein [Algoriphagus lutimaris]